MEFQQRTLTIDAVVQRVRKGKLALPEFQRDFVWKPSAVVELLDSISRRWPIGSLLLLNGPQQFAFRSIESGPMLDSAALDMYILDGQQRVTSLFHAFANVSEYCYYVDLGALIDGDDEPIRSERRRKFERLYPDVERRANARVALIQEISEMEAFFKWISFQPDDARAHFVAAREQRLAGLRSGVYQLMTVELDQGIEFGALARVFETLNRTGVDLDTFDLMVAKLYPTGVNLRQDWETALEQHPLLHKLQPGDLEIPKLISLLIRIRDGKKAARGVRQGDLLALEADQIRRYWAEAEGLYTAALEYAAQEFGVVTRDLVPSWNLLLGIAALISGNATAAEKRAWWVDRVLNQTFSEAANTRIVADIDRYFTSEYEMEFNSLDLEQLLEAPAKRNGMLMKGLGGFIVAAGGVDPWTGRMLCQEELLAFRSIDGQGVLRKVNVADTLKNLVLVSGETDRQLGREYNIGKEREFSIRLASQGIDQKTLTRSDKAFEKLLLGTGK
ncbi:DUF262 domain-containing protein [Burkholderia gladioli]|uniref:DUF262 domain-containing protein n=1 Tax=Burkholderia gladioli TaxID=28095 RepID=UPI003B97E356